MSLSEFARELSQRDARAQSEPINCRATYGDRSQQASAHQQLANGEARSDLARLNALATQLQGKPIPEQVKLVMADRCRFLGEIPSRRVMQDRCERIICAYSELRTMGFKISDVTSFGLRHARALLESWKQRGLAKKTIYNRWGSLRGWALALNKHGMLGSIEEFWPDFNETAKQPAGQRVLSAIQLQMRSDFLHGQSDKTAYLVDRLTREVGMVREAALEMEFMAAQTVAVGHDVLRCGTGAGVLVFKGMAKHRELFREAIAFMESRQRSKLGWPGLSAHDSVMKYRDRMNYVNRTLFRKDEKKGGAA